MVNDISIIPTFAPINVSPEMMNMIIIGLMLAFIAAVIFRLARHRIYVEIYESVKGGYVIRPGRFRKVFNKGMDMHSLVSMGGRQELPAFDDEDYQKVSGGPLIGIRRQIKLLKINRHTFYVLKPTEDLMSIGEVKPYNSMTWIYAKVNKEVDKILRRGGFKGFLSYAAPSLVIIISMIILASAIWTDRMLLEALGAQIAKVGTALAEVCKSWIG